MAMYLGSDKVAGNGETFNNLVTGGSIIKTGRVIDGKFEYVKRMNLTNFPGNGETKTWATGLNVPNIIVTDIKVIVLSGSGNWFMLPNNDSVNSKTSLNKDGNINVTCYQGNLKNCAGYAEIYYINK